MRSREINKRIGRRVFFILAFFSLSFTSFSFGAETDAVYPPDIQRILDRGKLIVAMHNEDAPPFFMHDKDGRFYGFDVELAHGIAKQLGVEVEFNREADTYNGVVDIVARHKADVAISYLSKTLERSKSVRFTNPYVTMNLAVLINRLRAAREKKGQDMPEILKNLDGRIGVLANSSHVGYVKEIFPNAIMKKYKAFDPDVINAVLDGSLFAGFFDELDMKRAIRKRPELSLRLQLVIMKDREDYIAIAVPWEDTHLLSWLNLYLKAHSPKITADKLLDRYPDIFTD